MPLVLLRAPLSELAGARELELEGGTVKEALIALESTRPAISGWVLDERRAIREHVNVYVNGQLAQEDDAGRRCRPDARPAGDHRRVR